MLEYQMKHPEIRSYDLLEYRDENLKFLKENISRLNLIKEELAFLDNKNELI